MWLDPAQLLIGIPRDHMINQLINHMTQVDLCYFAQMPNVSIVWLLATCTPLRSCQQIDMIRVWFGKQRIQKGKPKSSLPTDRKLSVFRCWKAGIKRQRWRVCVISHRRIRMIIYDRKAASEWHQTLRRSQIKTSCRNLQIVAYNLIQWIFRVMSLPVPCNNVYGWIFLRWRKSFQPHVV